MDVRIVSRCPHDRAAIESAIDFCPKCGDEFTGPKGTEIKFRVQAAERARILARIREEATKRDAEAERVLAENPNAFSAMSGPIEEIRKSEHAASAYRRFADAAGELRRMADLLESEGKP